MGDNWDGLARPKNPQHEARRAKAGDGVLEEGQRAACPPPAREFEGAL